MPSRQIFLCNPGKKDAVQAKDLVTQMLKNSPDNTISTGVNFNPHLRTIVFSHSHVIRLDKTILQLNTLTNSL